MKIIVRALMLCTAITAISNAISTPEEPKKVQYPMIEKYDLEELKKRCSWRGECRGLEKILWCAYNRAKAMDEAPKTHEIKQLCATCINQGGVHVDVITATMIEHFGLVHELSSDEVLTLFTQFNEAVAQAQRDGNQEKIKSIQELIHPN